MIGQLGEHLIVTRGQMHHFPLEFTEIPSLTFPLSHIPPATLLAEPSQTLTADAERQSGIFSRCDPACWAAAPGAQDGSALIPGDVNSISCNYPGSEVRTNLGAFICTPWAFTGCSIRCTPQSHRRYPVPQPLQRQREPHDCFHL